MHNPAAVLENDAHKLLWDFDIQTDHLILARQPDNNQQKKRTCKIVDFAISADYKVKLKEIKKDEYFNIADLKNL